ncbi:MAG: heme ABC transporter ATP-binding protein [Devosia sp.]|jgi:iron complex transport system ATP-binding protein|uniref:heme ABC transporter ATP-binding protein n=1 Tax=unclassified Devosia TaxID=196773 RepID=UPI0019E2757E|nr:MULTISPECIES: heme ABC transporter ATP-binding protein [unclassified Devosia]MBF0678696.1 heme ABC transporter ATP-binding protein [Devosia sp.]WEJ31735.1 heme ABC transporter ATP-binding protein [Devosia sp. SD17-2]
MIEVQDLSVQLGGRTILNRISMSAVAGELTAIIGPNGSGKSTLLKAVCRDHPYQGNVRINGRDLAALSPVEAATHRAVLPQTSTLPFPFTVREVVAMGISAGRPGPARAALSRLPEQALDAVDLPGFGGRYYGELSGGEQQRVQLARVLCQVWLPVLDGVPRFLLLDEPVSSLDIRHQLMIMDVARRFADSGGGVIAVLHDLNLAAMYADQVVALRKGELAASGRPEAVITDSVVEDVFECPLSVGARPAGGAPFVLPQSIRRDTPFHTRVA